MLRALKILAVVCFVMFMAGSFYFPLEFEDGWWHLSTGRWIVEHKAVPHEDPFSFTDQKSPWVLTQWLGSTLYYAAYQCGGYEGVKIFRALIFLGLTGLFMFYSRRLLPFAAWLLMSWMLFQALHTRCLMRPDVFNYFFLQLFLIQIFAYSRDRNPKHLWVLPALGILWGNMHLGSFVFGCMLLGLAWMNSAAQAAGSYLKRSNVSPFWSDLKVYTAVLIGYVLSLVVSPYGINAVVYPFKVFFVPDFINIYKFVNVVAEALPPNDLFKAKGVWALGLMAAGAASLFFMRRDRLLAFLIFAVPLTLYMRGRRASAFFALAAVYVIVECARQRSWKKWWDAWKHHRLIDAAVCVAAIVFFSIQFVHRVEKTVYMEGKIKPEWSLDFAYRNPVKAIEFLRQHNITGKVFTNDVIGGYLLWAGYPQLKPFVDGRQLNQELFSQYLAIIREGVDKKWDPIEKEHDFDIVILDTSLGSSYVVASYLANKERWQLVFVDGACLVYARKGRYHWPDDVEHLDDRLRAVPFSWAAVKQMDEASSQSRAIHVSRPPVYVDVLEEGATLFAVGFRGEGIRRTMQGFAINPVMARGVANGIGNVLLYEME